MRTLYIVICLLLLAMPAQANTLESEIQKKYQTISNMKTQFTQSLVHRESGAVQQRQGELLFQKPLSVRWETKTPHAELLVINDKEIWNYLPEEEVAYRYTKDLVQGSQALIEVITGQAQLNKDFSVQNLGQGEKDTAHLTILDLFPHEPTPDMVEARIWVDDKTKLIRKARITDFYGNTNELAFTSIETNVTLSKNTFDFTPPEGVDVEEGSKQGT